MRDLGAPRRYTKTISIDFDGVLHDATHGFGDGEIYGEPVQGAVEIMHNLSRHYSLTILTARDDKWLEPIREWLTVWGFPHMNVTNKKPVAIAYIDDRGIRFTNWKDMEKYFL